MAPSTATRALALLITLTLLSATLVTACGCPVQKPPSSPKPPAIAKCPLNTLKLGVCADVLGLVNVIIGSPPTGPCCSLIQGLTDIEAAICLCTALKANLLGINLNVPISLSILLNTCSKTPPAGFQCP